MATNTTDIQQIIDELKTIPGKKIVTWSALHATMRQGKFNMDGDAITTTTWNQLAALWPPKIPMSLVVRQSTDRKDEKTNLPIKVLHSYFVVNGKLRKLSKAEAAEAHEHTTSGEYIGKEDFVEYAE